MEIQIAMQNVTIFQKITDVDNPHHVSIETIVSRIKSGKSRTTTDKLRACTDAKERTKIKRDLPAICFSGTFSRREDNALIKHSGLIAIDFDHVSERMADLRQRLEADPHTFMLFLSPSGDGLKLVVKIPPSEKTHPMSAAALSDYYNDENLDEFRDVSRVCFESFDPYIFYNPESIVFNTIKEVEKVKRVIQTKHPITDNHAILAKIEDRLISGGKHYTDGNKHNFLVSMFGACNVFGIPVNEAVSMVSFKYRNAADKVDIRDFDRIAVSVYNNYSSQFGSCSFTEMGESIITETKVKISVVDMDFEIPLKDVIYLDAVREDMLQAFHSGRSMGETTHFKTIDGRFRWSRGELTLFHGVMNQGKTTMWEQLCLMKSIIDGYKWAVFSPEQDPPSDFYDDLIHMYVGRNTLPNYGNQMSEADYIRGMDFIKNHFFYIFPEDDSPTPEYINTRFEAVIKKHKVDGCVIDPYNQLDNDIKKAGGREDMYLSSFLSKQKRFAQQHQIYMIIVAHPKGTISKNGSGDFECPDIYDLAGGAMWGNKCDNIICVYRPFHRSAPGNGLTRLISQKIKKQKRNGTPGEVELIFDVAAMRYKENYADAVDNPLDRCVTHPDLWIEKVEKEAPF